ncbi:hypothetical protein BV898_09228 [Hypsibius exemplaris]|uniref:unspecific monooxygenase n=1 Tax=Hypsibius exemplaris TaxID=2072580 RepID=A0A1W0WNC2_HYPEX|nr:hypothetical protein BV898_09228 [Hypsibius exemplaris]
MQDAILWERDKLNEEIRKRKGESFNPRKALVNAAANVIASVAFGRTYKQGEEALAGINDSITSGMKQVLKAQLDQVVPMLRFIPFIASFRKDLNDSFQPGKRFLSGIVKEHTVEHKAEVRGILWICGWMKTGKVTDRARALLSNVWRPCCWTFLLVLLKRYYNF